MCTLDLKSLPVLALWWINMSKVICHLLSASLSWNLLDSLIHLLPRLRRKVDVTELQVRIMHNYWRIFNILQFLTSDITRILYWAIPLYEACVLCDTSLQHNELNYLLQVVAFWVWVLFGRCFGISKDWWDWIGIFSVQDALLNTNLLGSPENIVYFKYSIYNGSCPT
jgi:hypothetical protein